MYEPICIFQIRNQRMAKAKENLETINFTVFEFVQELNQKKAVELSNEQELTLKAFDLADFMTLASLDDNHKKVGLLQQVFARFGLQLFFEGSMHLKKLSLDDMSLTFSAGESKVLKITARPSFLRRSIQDLVGFLQNLPENGVIALKPNQDLLIEGFSKQELMDYYQVCSSNKDLQVQQNAQDALFQNTSLVLKEKGLNFRIFAANAEAINREINSELGGLYLRATSKEADKDPVILMGLAKK